MRAWASSSRDKKRRVSTINTTLKIWRRSTPPTLANLGRHSLVRPNQSNKIMTNSRPQWHFSHHVIKSPMAWEISVYSLSLSIRIFSRRNLPWKLSWNLSLERIFRSISCQVSGRWSRPKRSGSVGIGLRSTMQGRCRKWECGDLGDLVWGVGW